MAFSTVRMNTPNRKRNKSSYDSGATFSVPEIKCDRLEVAGVAVSGSRVVVVANPSTYPWATALDTTFTFTKSAEGLVAMTVGTITNAWDSNNVFQYDAVVPVGYRTSDPINVFATVSTNGVVERDGATTITSNGNVTFFTSVTNFGGPGAVGIRTNTFCWHV